MRLLVVVAFLLSVSCRDCELDPLGADETCTRGLACWFDERGTLRTDPFPLAGGDWPCKAGVTECAVDGIECRGYVAPVPETCNGVDDDCDGLKDQWWGPGHTQIYGLDRWPSDPTNTCPSVGRCQYAYQYCEGVAGYVCNYTRDPEPETCNGVDDDCDGVVDNGLDQPVFYYPEDDYPNTVGVGACKPGVRRCFDGMPTDTPPVLPIAEVCGNGVDDDCDGAIDENADNTARSFALVVDVSSSMTGSGHYNTIKSTICGVTNDPAFASTLFSVVFVSTDGEPAPFVEVRQDFADVGTTCQTLTDALSGFPEYTGDEYMYEGMVTAGSLAWPAGTKRVELVFTDETPQWFQATQQDVAADCTTLGADYEVDMFTISSLFWQWDPIAGDCGGATSLLDVSSADLAQAIRDRLAGGC